MSSVHLCDICPQCIYVLSYVTTVSQRSISCLRTVSDGVESGWGERGALKTSMAHFKDFSSFRAGKNG